MMQWGVTANVVKDIVALLGMTSDDERRTNNGRNSIASIISLTALTVTLVMQGRLCGGNSAVLLNLPYVLKMQWQVAKTNIITVVAFQQGLEQVQSLYPDVSISVGEAGTKISDGEVEPIFTDAWY